MKVKLIFSAVILAVLCMGTANAQITPSTQSASLTGTDKAILDQRISKYTAFTIDKKEMTDYLYGSGGVGQIRLKVNEKLDWTIDLELNDMREPDYRSTYTTDEGTFENKEPFVVNTFKGETSDGQIARFTIDENTFLGVILGDNYHYVIRSAKDYTQNIKDEMLIAYHSWDIIPDDNHFDYVNDALKVSDEYLMLDLVDSPNNTTATSRSSCPNYYLGTSKNSTMIFQKAEVR